MLGLSALLWAGCAGSSPRFTTKANLRDSEHEPVTYRLQGIASYYANEFHGRKTANGEIYDMHGLTAAHPTLPFNTKLLVKNLESRKSVIVRINDRGPFKDNRIIDLSLEAAKQVGLIANGTALVELEIIELGVIGK